MTPAAMGHYRLLDKLGEGGMGIVYKALDTHLDRLVALKILPPDKVADPERKRRFVQEAKAASALNHPNIVTIYEIGSSDERDFIAMEFIDGKTLSELTPPQGMQLKEALRIALAITDALTKAHAAGITHRDLKPPNVMVNAEGQVKLLDFGLAKLTDRKDTSPADQTLSATGDGAIVGTVAYMSPEHAEGKRVDTRSDIFAFGAVLYEMITGHRAFRGDTPASTLGAVIHKEPVPLRELAKGLPPDLDKLITRCLRKDADRRYQNMADLRVALREIKEEYDSGLPVTGGAVAPTAWRWARPGAAGFALACLLAAGAWWTARNGQAEAPKPLLRPEPITADDGLSFEPALSPDGKLIAYASDRMGEGNLDIWLRHVSGGDPIRLTKHPGDDHQPSFTPDGGSIVFRSTRDGGGIYVMPALGGEARVVAKGGFNPRVSPDGTRVVYFVAAPGAGFGTGSDTLFVVPLVGGEPQQIAGVVGHAPVWSWDGKRILFRGYKQADRTASGENWWLAKPDGSEPRNLDAATVLARHGFQPMRRQTPEAWSSDGKWIVFTSDRSVTKEIWRARIDGTRLTGTFERLSGGTLWDTQASLAANGLLAFSSTSFRSNLWSLPVSPNHGTPKGEMQRVTHSTAFDQQPRLSRDGRMLAYVSNRSGYDRVWIRDMVTGVESPATVGLRPEAFPTISGDGRRILFLAGLGGRRDLLMVDGPGATPRTVWSGCSGNWDLSADGRWALVAKEGERGLTSLDLMTGKTTGIAQTKSVILTARFSEDTRWISFHAITSRTTRQIYVMPFRGAGPVPESEWIPVTDGTMLDRDTQWSPDGGLLYWQTDRDGFRCFIARRLDPATKQPRGEPFFVKHFHEPSLSTRFFTGSNATAPVVALDRLIFALGERKGNVWTMQLDPK